MALILSFHLAVTLLLVLVHQQAAGEPNNFDLDKAVERIVKRRAKIYKMEAIWWDMYRKQDEVKTYGYEFPPVTATVGDVVYGAEKSSPKQPSIVFTKWVRNGHASLSQRTTVQRTIKRETRATWHVEVGFSYSGSVTASARMYAVNIATEQPISLNLKGGHSEEVSKMETLSITDVVVVPPMKSVKIEWLITDTVQDIFWTSPVTVTGYFFVKYHIRQTRGPGFLSFSSLNFLSKDDRFKQTRNNTYLYTAKGTFTGVTTKESELRVSEYDYHAYGGNFSAVMT